MLLRFHLCVQKNYIASCQQDSCRLHHDHGLMKLSVAFVLQLSRLESHSFASVFCLPAVLSNEIVMNCIETLLLALSEVTNQEYEIQLGYLVGVQ